MKNTINTNSEVKPQMGADQSEQALKKNMSHKSSRYPSDTEEGTDASVVKKDRDILAFGEKEKLAKGSEENDLAMDAKIDQNKGKMDLAAKSDHVKPMSPTSH